MFTVYSKPNCPFCDKAKALLELKGMQYQERIIDVGQPKAEGKVYVTVQELKEKVPTAKSVPQIFNGDEHIGGFNELNAILTRGES